METDLNVSIYKVDKNSEMQGSKILYRIELAEDIDK